MASAAALASPLLLDATPSIEALQKALTQAAASIADFDEASRAWTAYHLSGRHPIIGPAWRDYQGFAQQHGAAVCGLRGLKNAVNKDLAWVEKIAEEAGTVLATCPSSNASFLCALWHHTLYSALHQPPLVEIDASFPMSHDASTIAASSMASRKPAKVDIVCDSGNLWIRIASIKPLSLLSEFRQAESYITTEDSDEDDEASGHQAKSGLARMTESSKEDMEALLNKQALDSAAANCSLLRLAQELNDARKESGSSSAKGPPRIHIVLSRLSLRDTVALDSKFYDGDEKRRYEARLGAIQKELHRLGIKLVAPEDRELSRAANGKLPRIPFPPQPAAPTPTTVVNLDLSALIALVSSVSHMPLPERPEEADACFSRVHWKQAEAIGASARTEQRSSADDERGLLDGADAGGDKSLQHARALSEQLQREMSGDAFFEALIHHLPIGCGKLQMTCTSEARDKMTEIVKLVGGETEQRRMRDIFDESPGGAQEFWRSSRWEVDQPRERRVRESVMLPVRVMDTSCRNVQARSEGQDSSTVFVGPFANQAIHCVRGGMRALASKERSLSNRTGLHRQTPHTLSSMLLGLQNGHTTLTTNISSVKWLVKDIVSTQAIQGSLPGYETGDGNDDTKNKPRCVTIAALWVMYPRSLAEKMTLSNHVGSDTAFAAAGGVGLGAAQNSTLEEIHTTAYSADSLTNSTTRPGKESPKDGGDSPGSDTITYLKDLPTTWRGSSHQGRGSSFSPRGMARPLRFVLRWIKGPRPKGKLEIKHFKWWPLGRVERNFSRLTAPLAWKDPYDCRDEFVLGNSDGADVERQHNLRKEQIQIAERDDDDPWLAGVQQDIRLNAIHWTLLVFTFIGWILGFAFLVKSLWYEAAVTGSDGSTSTNVLFLGCTSSLWSANSQCGLNGQDCAPFSSNRTLAFRCPSNCQATTLGGPRAVGDQLPSFVPLIVGGGNASTSERGNAPVSAASEPYIYRGDSFICSAAIHAGALARHEGGCGSIWITGAHSGYEAVERNGLQSTAFNSTFPVSYYFDQNLDSEQCTDRRSSGYALDVVLLAWVGLILRPKPIVYFFTLICVGFWHINFISEPREYPMSIGDPMGDFLPTLFIGYALWRLTFRYVWAAFKHFPLEGNIWILGFFWIGTLLDVVFSNVPLQRLVLSDIQQQPGALTSLVVIIVVVVILAINQVRVIRKVGALPKYLSLAIVGGIIVGLLAAVPTTGLRLHHYIVALVLLPFCAFETRLSLLYCSFLLGMFLNGSARWGYDGLIQDVSVIVGSGISGTTLPAFLPASNWSGISPYSTAAAATTPTAGTVFWEPLPENVTDDYDSFQLLVDDVLRLQSTETSFDLTLLPQYYLGSKAIPLGARNASDDSNTTTSSLSSTPADAMLEGTQSNFTMYPGGADTENIDNTLAAQPHYLRLAFYDSSSNSVGDFTKAATVYFNGTFIPPSPGAT